MADAASTENTFVNEPDRVVIYDSLGEDAIRGSLDYPDDKAAADLLLVEFEPVPHERGHWHADPNEDYYQGITVMSVIRRKSDGRLFGFPYWTPISKHGEANIEPNGDEHGLEFDVPRDFDWNDGYYPQPFVFLPVEPFTITGYKIADTIEEGSK